MDISQLASLSPEAAQTMGTLASLTQAAVFYVFGAVLLFSALMVVTARNPVHGVLFLILAFFNAAGLFLMLGAEFAAMILVIVYVGAVAVLFLFVVMMLNINFAEAKTKVRGLLPLGLIVGAMLTIELGTLALGWPALMTGKTTPVAAEVGASVNNTVALGQQLYTTYLVPFQIAGIILLVAMIGAIVLTLRVRPGVLHQKIASQVERRPSDVIKINTVKSGEGA